MHSPPVLLRAYLNERMHPCLLGLTFWVFCRSDSSFGAVCVGAGYWRLAAFPRSTFKESSLYGRVGVLPLDVPSERGDGDSMAGKETSTRGGLNQKVFREKDWRVEARAAATIVW